MTKSTKVYDSNSIDGKAIYQLCPHCGKFLCAAEAMGIIIEMSQIKSIDAAFVCECGASWSNVICYWNQGL